MALLPAALAAVPLAASDYQLFRLANVLVYGLALVGMHLLTGYNGQISLGRGAFYAIGAYATALLVVQADVPHGLALPMAAVVRGVVGFVFSLPLLRLKTMHLAMATIAIGVVLPTPAKWKGVEQYTGGTRGLGMADAPAPCSPASAPCWLPIRGGICASSPHGFSCCRGPCAGWWSPPRANSPAGPVCGRQGANACLGSPPPAAWA